MTSIYIIFSMRNSLQRVPLFKKYPIIGIITAPFYNKKAVSYIFTN